MKMELKTVYDLKALQVIKNFIISTAKFAGAGSSEISDIELAAEEAVVHIISSYPFGHEDIFTIYTETADGVFRIVLNNMGVPVDETDIPEYHIENPENSLDGLQFFLIEKLTDKFYFLPYTLW